jgi:adenosine kinase
MIRGKRQYLIVTGSMSWDTIMDFPSRFIDYLNPEKLHQINVSFVVDTLKKQIGGTATNIAYAASQALSFFHQHGHVERVTVRVLGGLGKDAGAHLRFFKKHGIDASRIIIDKRMYSASGSVMTDINDNQIWGFYYGASAAARWSKLDDFKNSKSLIIISANHPESFLHFQHEAVRLKIPYMFDPGMALSWIKDADLTAGVLAAQFLIGNDYEIAMVCKRIKLTVKALNKRGVNVIVTLGIKGVQYYPVRGKPISISAVTGINVVDPTGAGDAWRGGFLTALSLGKPIKDALVMGNAVASFAVEHYGCVNYHIESKALNRRIQFLIANH